MIVLCVGLLTCETSVEHPAAHQQKGEQKKDEVVMVPRT